MPRRSRAGAALCGTRRLGALCGLDDASGKGGRGHPGPGGAPRGAPPLSCGALAVIISLRFAVSGLPGRRAPRAWPLPPTPGIAIPGLLSGNDGQLSSRADRRIPPGPQPALVGETARFPERGNAVFGRPHALRCFGEGGRWRASGCPAPMSAAEARCFREGTPCCCGEQGRIIGALGN